MIKQYKLIKCYPGSPELGSIHIEDHYRKNYPEFWEEIKPKNYEILSFQGITPDTIAKLQLNGNFKYNFHRQEFTLDEMINSLSDETVSVKIHSVKRLSDGEVFTVGDKLIGTMSTRDGDIIISSFTLFNGKDGETIHINHSTGTTKYAFQPDGGCVKVKKKTSLFITEDNVEIFEGDEYWIVCTMSNNHIQKEPPARKDWKQKDWGYKYFSTKQAAEEYIAKNKVLFVTEDGVNIHDGDIFFFVDSLYTVGKGKASNKFTKLITYKEFSTKEKAQEYIDMNKPMYSKNDVEKMFITIGNSKGYYNTYLKVLKHE